MALYATNFFYPKEISDFTLFNGFSSFISLVNGSQVTEHGFEAVEDESAALRHRTYPTLLTEAYSGMKLIFCTLSWCSKFVSCESFLLAFELLSLSLCASSTTNKRPGY